MDRADLQGLGPQRHLGSHMPSSPAPPSTHMLSWVSIKSTRSQRAKESADGEGRREDLEGGGEIPLALTVFLMQRQRSIHARTTTTPSTFLPTPSCYGGGGMQEAETLTGDQKTGPRPPHEL